MDGMTFLSGYCTKLITFNKDRKVYVLSMDHSYKCIFLTTNKFSRVTTCLMLSTL